MVAPVEDVENYTFYIVHLITSGDHVGELETIVVSGKDMLEGVLMFDVSGLSPIATSYSCAGEHTDTNKDHVCEKCYASVGECVDTDNNHKCDYGCGKNFGDHTNGDRTHICGYCGLAASVCFDQTGDGDHKCDVCDEPIAECDAGESHKENEDPATCTEPGSYDEVVRCTECNEELSRKTVTVPAPGHTPGVEATCTTAQICTVCEAELAPVKGHTEVIDAAVDPTCTTTGLTEGKHCSECNKVLDEQDVVLALGHIDEDNDNVCDRCDCEICVEHTYELEVIAPTCTKEGYTLHTCKVCEHSYVSDYVSALGHKYDAVVTDPTCTKEGYTTYTCSVCDYTYVADHVSALGHDYKAAVTPPTCTKEGYTTYTCSVCDHTYIADYVSALGHTEVTDSAVEPGCEDTGLTEGKHCSVCGKVIVAQEVVPAKGHTYDNNCDADCDICGATRPISHQFGDWVVTTQPTKDAAGMEDHKCSVCGYTETREVPALPQNGFAWIIIVVTGGGGSGTAIYFFVIKKKKFPWPFKK